MPWRIVGGPMSKKQVQASLTDEEIEALDKLAKQSFRSRSYMIAKFIREGVLWTPIKYHGKTIGRMDTSQGTQVALVKASGLQVGD